MISGGKIGGAKTAKIHQAAYDAAYAGLYPLVVKLYGMGLSFEKIAKEFNQRGRENTHGRRFLQTNRGSPALARHAAGRHGKCRETEERRTGTFY